MDVRSYLSKAYRHASSGLQQQIAETITGLVERAMRPILMRYINGTFKMSTGETLQGQSAFDRLVREDKDVLALIEKYRPSYMFYLDKARGVKDYILWDSGAFASNLMAYLVEQGIRVDDDGYDYLVRTCDRFRDRIYGP